MILCPSDLCICKVSARSGLRTWVSYMCAHVVMVDVASGKGRLQPQTVPKEDHEMTSDNGHPHRV